MRDSSDRRHSSADNKKPALGGLDWGDVAFYRSGRQFPNSHLTNSVSPLLQVTV